MRFEEEVYTHLDVMYQTVWEENSARFGERRRRWIRAAYAKVWGYWGRGLKALVHGDEGDAQLGIRN